jgi:exopolysaccharide production protein ExoQ
MIDQSRASFDVAGLASDRQPLPPLRSGRSAVPSMSGRTIRTVLLVATAAACSALLFGALPDDWMWEAMRLLAVGVVLLFLFLWAFRLPAVRPKPAFVIWCLVLVSGCIFFRSGDLTANASAFEGKFPAAVYGEVIGWILYLLAVLVLFAPVRQYFGRLFAGDYKWVTLFAMLCLASCIYAPRAGYALAWAFKLAVVVLLLQLCSTEMNDFADTVSFLRFTFWAYAVVVAVPVILGAMSGSPFDEEGRMSPIVSPNALGPDAGAVFILALTLYSRAKNEGLRKSAILVGAAALVVMVLAGSKTGMVGAIIAGVFFFILLRRFGSAFGYIGAAAILVCVLALTTPLGSYFTNYEQSNDGATLTGRTTLWANVMPAIEQRPILGHGYQASTFVEFQVNAVSWGASHLHNGFVEVLYNNGAIGLIIIVILNFVIARNLIRVLRRTAPTDAIYRVAAGCLALYVHLFINGMANASFGGKIRPPFMLFLALVLVSDKLVDMVAQPQRATA